MITIQVRLQESILLLPGDLSELLQPLILRYLNLLLRRHVAGDLAADAGRLQVHYLLTVILDEVVMVVHEVASSWLLLPHGLD